jgi:hypothetical protein
MNEEREDQDRAEHLALRVVSLRRAGETLLEEARKLSEKYESLIGYRTVQSDESNR